MNKRRRLTEDLKWNFFSFPVAFAFALGGLVVLLIAPFFPIGILFIAFLFATSFGMAHIISHWFRSRTLDRRKQADEESERERRALAARAAAPRGNEEPARPRKRTRRSRRARSSDNT